MANFIGQFINFLPLIFFLGVMLYFFPKSARATQRAVDVAARSLDIGQEQTELLRRSVEINQRILEELTRLGSARAEKNPGSGFK